ncbi:MAG TPA: FAD binding domain-containing protein [Candidatus Limnocylindrales bacterium]|nr:FAD binding domain-containing protein [Candidatus Limnocylindrales bacterium]
MIPRFSLTRARQLDEAFEAFAAAGGEAAYLAGGTELLQVMKMGLAQFGTLVDVKRLPELRGLSLDDGRIRIGAATTHRELERSALLAEQLPAFCGLARRVANVRVRSQGTLGGNLCFAEPHSDPATLLLVCDGRLELAGPAGRREVGAADFVLGPLSTDRAAEEILLSVTLAPRAAGAGVAYEKIAFFERPAVSLAVRLEVGQGGDGRIGRAVVAVGSIGERPTLLPQAAQALTGADRGQLPDAIAAARERLAEVEAVPDLNGSPDYKRHLAGVLLGRAATQAYEEAVSRA